MNIALADPVPMKKTREGFGRALVDLGEQDPRIVVLVGDLSESTMVHFFAERFPDRFIQVDRKSTRLNSSHIQKSRMPSSA